MDPRGQSVHYTPPKNFTMIVIRTDKCNKEQQLINLLAGTNNLISRHPQNK